MSPNGLSSMAQLRGISSMAMRQLLVELTADFRRDTGCAAEFIAVGGVDAFQRVQKGEAFDVVVLASEAVDRLEDSGRAKRGSRADLVTSRVAVAVKAGAPHPDISNEEAVRRAVLAAPSIGYSTGPSGSALLALFRRWGVGELVESRLVQAPPGVPVANLISDGDVAIGFQQLSELMGLSGVDLLGTMPDDCAIVTTFSGAVCSASPNPAMAVALLDFLRSPRTEAAKLRHGMHPA